MAWTNPDLILFHGTIQTSATSILVGVSVASGKPRTDFGRGFYTTTSEQQARDWANKQVTSYNHRYPLAPSETPAIVEFSLERNALASLESMWFVRGDVAAIDYWNLVRHFRAGSTMGKHHQRTGPKVWYDVAIGPLAASWRSVPRVHSDMDQISFHSTDAELLLNGLPANQKRQLP
jgi:hypothetical protein